MTNTQVHEAVVRWLAALLSIQIIKDRQQGPRPTQPYGMVDLVNWGPVFQNAQRVDYKQLDSDNSAGLKEIEATPIQELEWTFLFFVYGDGGADKMRQLQSAYHLSQIQEPLRPELVVFEISQANSLPELIDERWEPRAQVNIAVRGISDDGFVIDTIEQTEFDISGDQ